MNRIKKINSSNLEPLEKRFLLVLESYGDIKRDIFFSKFQEFDIFSNAKKDRTLRLLKSQLIEKGYPIGSSNSRGYFFIKNAGDLLDAQKELESKAKSLFKTASLLQKGTFNFYELPAPIKPYQFNLFDEEVK